MKINKIAILFRKVVMKNKKIKISQKKVSYSKFMDKIEFYEKIINKTQVSVENYKTNDIINASDFNICIQNLETIYEELKAIKICINIDKTVSDQSVNNLQKINDDLSVVFKTFGTKKIFDLLTICFGTNYINNLYNDNDAITTAHINLIKKYAHPVSYKVIPWKNEPKKTNTSNKIIKNKIIEDFMIIEMGQTFRLLMIYVSTTNNFYCKSLWYKISFSKLSKKKILSSSIALSIDDYFILLV